MSVVGTVQINMQGDDRHLKRAADNSKRSVKGMAGSINKSMGGMVASTKRLAGSFMGLAAAIGGAAAGNALKNMALEAAEGIKQLDKLSKSLDTSVESLSALQYAGRVGLQITDNSQINEALSEMQKKIGEIGTGGGNIELWKALGLDTTKMMTQDAVENFKEISDAVSGLTNNTDKLFALDQIFGGVGKEMLPLMEGADKLEKLFQQAGQRGAIVSEAEVQAIQEANEAMQLWAEAQAQIGREAAQAAAPAIADMAEGASGLSPVISAAVHSFIELGKSISVVLTPFKWLARITISWISLIPKLGKMIGYFVDKFTGLTFISDLAKSVDNFFNKLKSWMDGEKIKPPQYLEEEIEVFIGDTKMGDVPEIGNSALGKLTEEVDEAAKALEENKKSIKDSLNGLQDELDKFGLSEVEVGKLDLLAKGATPEQLKEYEELKNKLDELTAAQEAKNEAEAEALRLQKKFRTSQQIMEDEVAELQRARDLGGLSEEIYQKRLAEIESDFLGRARSEPEEVEEAPKNRFAGLATWGSETARTAINRHQFGGGNDPWKNQKKQMDDQIETTKEVAVNVKQLVDIVRGGSSGAIFNMV